MTNKEILSHIDHTLLSPTGTWEQIQQLCKEAIAHNTASVCIPSSYVAKAREAFGEKLTICTVIGFPLGYSSTASKVFEAEQAVKNGADEIDMVINISAVKSKDFNLVKDEIKSIRDILPNSILKVIVETCYLDQQEKIQLCEIVTNTKADYIKTSTGFGTGGATHEDIELFKKHIGKNVKIKASGGIRDLDDLLVYLQEGCDRIGTSSALAMVKKHGETQ